MVDELTMIANDLRISVEIKDRPYRGRTYKNVFLHSDAVKWATSYVTRHSKLGEQNLSERTKGGSSCSSNLDANTDNIMNEADGVQLLNTLRQYGFIQHCVDPHKPFKTDETKKLYFCFVDDKGSKIQQNPSRQTQEYNRQKESARQALTEVLKMNADDFVHLQRRVERFDVAITHLTEAQVAVQTKLLIVQECTASLVEAVWWSAILLLILLVYTVVFVVTGQSFRFQQQHDSDFSTTICLAATVTLVLCGTVFVAQGTKLHSIWNALDQILVSSSEEEEDERDDESIISFDGSLTSSTGQPSTSMYPQKVTRRSNSIRAKRRQSSVFLKEPLFQRGESIGTGDCQNQLTTGDASGTPQPMIVHRTSNDIPKVVDWPHRPIFVCVNTPCSPNLKVEEQYADGPCPLGKPFSFSSDLFEGKCLIRLKGVPSDDPESDENYFSGRRRLFQTVVQGRFKEPLKVSDVLTGHEFTRPLQNLPHPWILKAATNLIYKLAPGSQIQIVGSNPTMLAPLAATSQVVRADMPGFEPDISSPDEDLVEDCTGFGGKFSNGSVSTSGRKMYFSNPRNSSKYVFDTETVYTFDFYQNLLSCESYALMLGVANVKMAPVLDGQPIQCLSKTSDGRYLWSFQVWHESLVHKTTTSKKNTTKTKQA